MPSIIEKIVAFGQVVVPSMGGVSVQVNPALSPPRPTVAESTALIARMKACPHWQASSECGCGVNRCLAGKGREGKVSHQDCFECLQEVGGGGPGMSSHEFTLIVTRADGGDFDVEPASDALFEAGYDDALVGIRCGVPNLDFTREADSFGEAVASTTAESARSGVGPIVVRVEPDELG
ncbi:hypothetical protein [Singulisphaera sp. GP187]|uniref:hypothetical protein n=1 Tax=Singulisphaera sp. GP187 TaxID=1882752 RepID=UPI0020B178A8|nr:hypothetical protein [Singulisphaera sp. GP187]